MACGRKPGIGCGADCCGAPPVDALGLAGLDGSWDGYSCGPGDTWSRGPDCVEQAFCVASNLTPEECALLQSWHSRNAKVQGQPYLVINAKRIEEAGRRKAAGLPVLPPDAIAAGHGGGGGGVVFAGGEGSVLPPAAASFLAQHGKLIAGGLGVVLVAALVMKGRR